MALDHLSSWNLSRSELLGHCACSLLFLLAFFSTQCATVDVLEAFLSYHLVLMPQSIPGSLTSSGPSFSLSFFALSFVLLEDNTGQILPPFAQPLLKSRSAVARWHTTFLCFVIISPLVPCSATHAGIQLTEWSGLTRVFLENVHRHFAFCMHFP